MAFPAGAGVVAYRVNDSCRRRFGSSTIPVRAGIELHTPEVLLERVVVIFFTCVYSPQHVWLQVKTLSIGQVISCLPSAGQRNSSDDRRIPLADGSGWITEIHSSGVRLLDEVNSPAGLSGMFVRDIVYTHRVCSVSLGLCVRRPGYAIFFVV